MLHKLILPRLAGTREAVDDLLDDQHVPEGLAGDDLAVFCADLASGSSSFADQLVEEVLVTRKAQALILLSPSELFRTRVTGAAERRGLSDLVSVRSGAELPV